jgi:2-amino-4-hydroxy-6-hydroxymethyldihydropteridine diphosphokinase
MPPRPWVKAYLGLGANLGDPAAAVDAALHTLAGTAGMRGLRVSGLYRSAPLEASGPWYLNAVAELETVLTAPDLLQRLQALETAAGRERPYRNAPRTLDLDLLLYGDGRIDAPLLTVPHPRMWERAFVLLPLAELAPGRVPHSRLQAVQGQAIERLP